MSRARPRRFGRNDTRKELYFSSGILGIETVFVVGYLLLR